MIILSSALHHPTKHLAAINPVRQVASLLHKLPVPIPPSPLGAMAGPKKSRKKAASAIQTTPAPTPVINDDDGALIDQLMAQLESNDSGKEVQTESAQILNEMNLDHQADKIESKQKQDSKSRYKARQARKAAALAQTYAPGDAEAEARLEREAREEERAIQQSCAELGLRIHQINPDGHCLYSAVGDQLALHGLIPKSSSHYAVIRAKAAAFMQSHPDEFLPFLLNGDDPDAGLMTLEQFRKYCNDIKDTAVWGGEPEIMALSRAYNVPIHVVQGDVPKVVIHNPPGSNTENINRPLRISYHRKLYGLGEHYNSLRPVKSGSD
ncbi:hypothetical protein AX16_003730 [Volvariella volvacea WC 439]|nr:hypothetical protein AX16_003730 [Volvariella volvacea WC 439]